MRKINAILVATIGILFVLTSLTIVSAYADNCSPTRLRGNGMNAEKSPACSGRTDMMDSGTQEDSGGFLASYFQMRSLLAGDEIGGLRELAVDLGAETREFRMASAEKGAPADQLEALETIEKAALAMKPVKAVDRLDSAREHFKALSRSVIAYVKEYGFDGMAYSFHCPMVTESWLQETDRVGNPYYGSKMLKCGTMTGRTVKGKYMTMSDETWKGKMEGEHVQQEHRHL